VHFKFVWAFTTTKVSVLLCSRVQSRVADEDEDAFVDAGVKALPAGSCPGFLRVY